MSDMTNTIHEKEAMIEFQPFPKIPRLNRQIIVTEKIDGTNAAVIITEDGEVGAQSRKRLITPGNDNFGFAGWVHDNAEALSTTLGPGRHFGEWWGQGIQRGYGLAERRFSLFNVHRWQDSRDTPIDKAFGSVPQLHVVPVLYLGEFRLDSIQLCIDELARSGSVAAEGFDNPEGVIVYHQAGDLMFKQTIHNDGIPKALQQ